MALLRTIAPAGVTPPTADEMREAAAHYQVKKFAPDLVTDLCNLAAGGSVAPPSVLRAALRRAGKAARKDAAKLQKYHERVSQFLRTLDAPALPGPTPLAKAMRLLRLLAQKTGGTPGSGGGELLPIFLDGPPPAELAKELQTLDDAIEHLSDEERTLLAPQVEDPELQGLTIADDMQDASVWLRVARTLQEFAQMRTTRSRDLHVDPEGDDVRTRQIADFSELPRIQKTEWALPSGYRTYRIATHVSPVRERMRRDERKQLLYMLIDCSGSMKDGQRISTAGGILLNRLTAVVRGEAELIARFFDGGVYPEHVAKTPREAQLLIARFRKENFSGGSTDISGSLRTAQERIVALTKGGALIRPELVIVTDGDASINLTAADLAGTRLHAFVVGGSNPTLLDLARQTGGVGIDRII